jgi:hypothetical protein
VPSVTITEQFQSRRVLVVANHGDGALSSWLSGLQTFGFDVHVFPLDWRQSHSGLGNTTVHRLFPPLRPG